MIKYEVVVYTTGDKIWKINSQLHREDGPACEYTIGNKFWYQNGKLHREDGPAVEWANGDREWYLYNEYLSEEEFNRRVRPAKEMTIEEIQKILGHKIKVVE